MAALAAILFVTGCGDENVVFISEGSRNVAHIDAAGKYVLIPVQESCGEKTVEIMEGDEIRSLRIRLAENAVDYHVPLVCNGILDISVQDSLTPLFLQNVLVSDEFEGRFKGEMRPRNHFSAPYGWINDPNGLICLDGWWHLYYQHNPYGAKWGNMTWGHARSRDLVNWEHLGDALFPDVNGNAFSGCCLVDRNNTAGFGAGALIAMYTSDAPSGQTQSLAYSTDGGMSFVKYSGNPVLSSDEFRDFRDPKVFWHEDTGKWVMALTAAKTVRFYSSEDLKSWTFESSFDNSGLPDDAIVWECPDLFQMNDAEGNEHWVLLCSNLAHSGSMSVVRYFVGDFDGRNFKVISQDPQEIKFLDYGPDYYAVSTWTDVPDGRRVAAAWMNGVAYAGDTPYDGGFRGIHTYPRELFLYESDGEMRVGNRLCSEVAAQAEIISVRRSLENPFTVVLSNDDGECVRVYVDTSSNIIRFDRSASGQVLFHDRFVHQWEVPLPESDGIQLDFAVDRTSVECFINGGTYSTSFQVFPSSTLTTINIEQ